MKKIVRKIFVLAVGVVVMSIAGCGNQEPPGVKRSRLIAVENMRLKKELGQLAYPLYFLDFETVTTAIPLYEDIAPYTQIPTQYSLHVCGKAGQVVRNYDYL